MSKADNEGTRAPYWIIIDPHQMLKPDVFDVASMITGVFFSREDAEKHLRLTRHNHTNRAVVFCLSGWESILYDSLWYEAEKLKHKEGVK